MGPAGPGTPRSTTWPRERCAHATTDERGGMQLDNDSGPIDGRAEGELRHWEGDGRIGNLDAG